MGYSPNENKIRYQAPKITNQPKPKYLDTIIKTQSIIARTMSPFEPSNSTTVDCAKCNLAETQNSVFFQNRLYEYVNSP